LHGTPERLTIDIDATLVNAHSEKEQATGNYKGGYGFHPLQVLDRGLTITSHTQTRTRPSRRALLHDPD
jgi:hypothetical protein